MKMCNSRQQFLGVPVLLKLNSPLSGDARVIDAYTRNGVDLENEPYYLLVDRTSSVR